MIGKGERESAGVLVTTGSKVAMALGGRGDSTCRCAGAAGAAARVGREKRGSGNGSAWAGTAELMAKQGSKQRPMIDEDDGAASLAPVGGYPDGASRFGMLDMAGNVWEWTESTYCTYPEHACSSQYRVFRGGGWGSTLTAYLRPTARMWSHPAHRYNDVGFRCAKGS